VSDLRLAKALLKVDVLGGSIYWAHGDNCPQRYKIDKATGCICGVEEASTALGKITDAAQDDLGLTGKTFDNAEEFVAFLDGAEAALPVPALDAQDAVLAVLTDEGWVADPDATEYNLRVAALVVAAAGLPVPALDALRAKVDDLLLDALDQLTGWTSNTSNRAVTAIDLIEQARAALGEDVK